MTTDVRLISVSNVTYVQKDNKKVRSTGGSIGAASVGLTLPVIISPATNLAFNKFKKIANVSDDKVEILHRAAEEALVNANLHSKDIKINYVPEILKPTPEDKLYSAINPVLATRLGNNAYAVPKDGKFFNFQTLSLENIEKGVYIPEKKLAISPFHELGHQMNYHFSKIGKCLQYMRGVSMILPLVIMLYGAFSQKSEPDEDGNLSKIGKVNNFVRNHAGLLSFLAFTPILLEEGMASIKGQKLANKVLSADMAKLVKKGNIMAYLTYAISGIAGGLASWAAVKVKDRAIEKKKQKIMNQIIA